MPWPEQFTKSERKEWRAVAEATFPSAPTASRRTEYDRLNRARARASQRALQRLKRRHPEEYRALYLEERATQIPESKKETA